MFLSDLVRLLHKLLILVCLVCQTYSRYICCAMAIATREIKIYKCFLVYQSATICKRDTSPMYILYVQLDLILLSEVIRIVRRWDNTKIWWYQLRSNPLDQQGVIDISKH